VSAKQNLSPPRALGFVVLCQLLGFVLFFLPSPVRAGSLEDAAHELALKVCAASRKQPVSVHWQEAPDSSRYWSDSPQKAFLDQISACGIELTDGPNVPVLNVTVQMTASRLLLVADSPDETRGRQIHIVEIPRSSFSLPRETASAPQLRKQLLLQQEKPIQSAVEWEDQAAQERFLFLLSDGQFVRSRFENGAWKAMDSVELPQPARRSRLDDGTFYYNREKEALELLADGKECEINTSGHVSFACKVSQQGERVLSLLSNCDEGPLRLAVGKGDDTQADRIMSGRAEVGLPSREREAGSLDMPGPVLDITLAEDSKAAFAVVRNLSTGNYEVYRITAVCSN
jgi:hypothetical protein